MPILPSQFDSTPVYQLLLDAEKGLVGFDRRLLNSLLNRREETLTALVQFTTELREIALLDLTEQVFDLFRYFRAPEGLPFFIGLFLKRGEGIPDPLAEAFAEMGEPAVEPLLELYDESTEDDQPDIVFLLVTLSVRHPRILELVEKTLAADPYEGALCAGLYGDPALTPTVEACLSTAGLTAEEKKVLEECLDALRQERIYDEPEPFEILPLYPEEAMPLFDQILPEEVIPFFDCEEPAYRACAALSFADDDYPDELRDRFLDMAQNDQVPQVRGAALRALGERVAEEPVREVLLGALASRRDQPEEWLGALIGLAGAGSDPRVQAAILEAYEDESTRAAALQTMWRTLDERYRKYFALNLKNEDDEIRRQAVQGVGAFPLPELAFELIPLFQDAEVREEALFSYALAVKHNTTPKSVHKLYEMIAEKAGGLSDSEEETLSVALDRRLEREGFEPVFMPDEHDEHDHDDEAAPVQEPARSEKIGRNDPCPCGSGKKYKKCCGVVH
jgi:HEAT repeat protein